MPDTGGRFAQQFNRHLHATRLDADAILVLQRCLHSKLGKGLIWLASWGTQFEENRNHHITRLGNTLGQAPVGIQCQFRLFEQLAHVSKLTGQRRGRW